ncbi:HNH endonuclease signature motif containing protein [Kribbella sancticallisti]|uniref:HNH endonuclease signature motif containing protein n=1 Tax=Kribbella sancticallisti TaxID=460087 RepID=A0ABN2DT37_9ACTN
MELRPVWSMSGSEKLTALDAVHDELTRLAAYRLQLMADLEESGHAQEIGARDTVHLVAFRHRLDPTAVRRDLKLATALAKYELVAAALPAHDDGDAPAGPLLHLDQARAIVMSLEAIPKAAMVPVESLVAAEARMVEAARVLTPTELSKLGQQVRNVLDTDGPEPAEDKAYRNETFWMKNADHGLKFGGYLANENAELLQTLIHDNAKPHKTVDGQPDPRSRDKRQADALTTVLTAAAGSGDTGHTRIKPHITVTIGYADLKGLATNGVGDLVFGDGLSAAAVRRLACDAGVLPIVLGSESQPLDVGMEERFVTSALRTALNARDKGCVVCGAPPIHCDAHHLVHWVDGGPTAIDNLALFCKGHHIDVHSGHWKVSITNGVVHVSRPSWAEPGPHRRLRRSAPTAGQPADAPAAPSTWPHTDDTPWITPDEAARHNPWGDGPLRPAMLHVPNQKPDTTRGSPWGDANDLASPGP